MRFYGLAILGVLAACPFAAQAETKTVSWYKAHPDVRAKVNGLCMNNPGEARNNANCINAEIANEHADLDRMSANIDHPTVRCVPSSPQMLIADLCFPTARGR